MLNLLNKFIALIVISLLGLHFLGKDAFSQVSLTGMGLNARCIDQNGEFDVDLPDCKNPSFNVVIFTTSSTTTAASTSSASTTTASTTTLTTTSASTTTPPTTTVSTTTSALNLRLRANNFYTCDSSQTSFVMDPEVDVYYTACGYSTNPADIEGYGAAGSNCGAYTPFSGWTWNAGLNAWTNRLTYNKAFHVDGLVVTVCIRDIPSGEFRKVTHTMYHPKLTTTVSTTTAPSTTTAVAAPVVSILANGAAGNFSLYEDASVTITWNSIDATTCQSLGDWPNQNRPLANGTGISFILADPGVQTYTLSCTGPGGTSQNSVTVTWNNIQDCGPDFWKYRGRCYRLGIIKYNGSVSWSANQISCPYGGVCIMGGSCRGWYVSGGGGSPSMYTNGWCDDDNAVTPPPPVGAWRNNP